MAGPDASNHPVLPEALPPPPSSGTVYTPRQLALAVVRALKPDVRLRWLEPSVGDGAFLYALARKGMPREKITALDLETAKSPTDMLGQVERGRDFLAWAAEQQEPSFHRIVANPPYVALSKLPPALRRSVVSVEDPDGKPVRLSANYWYAFLCASLKLLKRKGSLGFVLPAAWDYADYAEPLRRRLPELFAEVEVHRCLKPMFTSVKDGCVVLIARGYREPGQHVLSRFEHRTLTELIENLSSASPKPLLRYIVPKGRPLGEVMQIRLGGVTGHSKFFLLTEEERKARELPPRSCIPVLTKAKHLTGGQITYADWEKLKKKERVWLFHPEKQYARMAPVERYLELPVAEGGCDRDRFKVRIREPWYLTPMPEKVHGFISGMSRFGIWLCLNRMSGLNATNTLYVVSFKKARKVEERAAWALGLLTSPVRESLKAIGRHYPDGLRKFEPGDLAELRVPEPRHTEGALEAYLTATEHLLGSNPDEASRIADEFFARPGRRPNP